MINRRVSISKIFTFDSAHCLKGYKGKCKNVHGHTFKLEVTVKGDVDNSGLVMDFSKLSSMVKKEIISYLDHKYLNEIFDFNATCENIGLWIWEKLCNKVEQHDCVLQQIRLWETQTSFVTIKREDML